MRHSERINRMHEHAGWLQQTANTLEYSVYHDDVPIRLRCRFLSRHLSRFEERTSWEHPVTVVTRIHLYCEAGATLHSAEGDRVLPPNAFVLLPAGMPLSVTYGRSGVLAYHLDLVDGLGLPVFDPDLGVQEFTDPELQSRIEAAIQNQDWLQAESLGFSMVLRFAKPLLDGLALRHVRAERFQRVIDRVQALPSPQTTVAALAVEIGMSRSALSKGFQRATGISLKDYILRVQIGRARELLTYTDMTVAAVADKLGYEDGNYFFRVFKRMTGLTPRQYRHGVHHSLG